MAEITGSSLYSHAGDFSARMCWIVNLDRKGMQIDVSVRAVVRTQTASNAPILDNHFQRISAADRSHWAPHHAQWVATLPARGGDQILVETQAFAHKPANPVVSVCASAYALIAARAAVQVEHEQALRFHQAVCEELIDRQVLHLGEALAILGKAFACDGFQSRPHIGEVLQHEFEVIARDTHDLDVVERRAGCRAGHAVQKGHLAEVASASKVGKNQLSARPVLRDLYEADANQVKAVGRFALAANDLARAETN
jgi:hypothetical protein